MNGYQIYKSYLLIKTHFSNETFDATKYSSTSGKVSTYEKRNDKKFFEYLSLRLQDKEVKPFFISQFIESENAYIINIIENLDDCIKTFQDWKRRMSRVQYNFENDCRSIKRFMAEKDLSFDNLFKANKNALPIIIRLVMEKHVNVETYVILEKVLTMSTQYDKMYGTDDHIYNSYALMIKKYNYYFKFINIPEYKNIMRTIFYDE